MKNNTHTEVIERAEEYVRKINEANHRTFTPQLEAHKQFLGSKLKDAVILAGFLTSLTIPLFVSDAALWRELTAIGLLMFASVLIMTIRIFFRATQVLAKYSLKLKEIQNCITEFSGECLKFSRGEIDLQSFLKKEETFLALYPDMRNNSAFNEVEAWDKDFLEKLAKGKLSEINLIVFFLITGIVFVILSVVLPKFF